MSKQDKVTGWHRLPGRVVEGHRVASGTAAARVYPSGTIEMQMPAFCALGLDLTGFYPGTLNVSIAPCRFRMVKPTHLFRAVEWTDLHPPENFSFSPARIVKDEGEYKAWVYYPDPATKARHFQDPSVVELISVWIPGVRYGDQVVLLLDRGEILVE